MRKQQQQKMCTWNMKWLFCTMLSWQFAAVQFFFFSSLVHGMSASVCVCVCAQPIMDFSFRNHKNISFIKLWYRISTALWPNSSRTMAEQYKRTNDAGKVAINSSTLQQSHIYTQHTSCYNKNFDICKMGEYMGWYNEHTHTKNSHIECYILRNSSHSANLFHLICCCCFFFLLHFAHWIQCNRICLHGK